ncbi:MAG: FAD-dependent oxidoreductase [Eubacteriales bacterium]|nr:FAD-dependent oxidoreductase [Eubacteriales bacterium]
MSVIIIGSGPAGISASLYAVRGNIETSVISNGIGSLERAEKIENYYGFAAPVDGHGLADAGKAQAGRLGVRFISGEAVNLSWDGIFSVTLSDNTPLTADSVIIATGMPRRTPKVEGFKRFDGAGISRCAVCDGFFHRGKNVAVWGSGEYAAHEAEELSHIAASVTLLTDGAEPQVAFPDGIKIITKKITALEGGERLENVRFDDGDMLGLSGLFVAIGAAGSAELAAKIGAATDGGYISVNEDMETGIPGLYAAGDCISVGERRALPQIAAAVYSGAVAGMASVKYCRSLK